MHDFIVYYYCSILKQTHDVDFIVYYYCSISKQTHDVDFIIYYYCSILKQTHDDNFIIYWTMEFFMSEMVICFTRLSDRMGYISLFWIIFNFIQACHLVNNLQM